jgi:hypothetical protein
VFINCLNDRDKYGHINDTGNFRYLTDSLVVFEVSSVLRLITMIEAE